MMRAAPLAFLFVALCGAVPASAQNADEQKTIEATLNARVALLPAGTPLDPARAGYYRVRIVPAGLSVRENLCPRDDADRDQIRKTAKGLYAFALKEKRDWGAAAQIVYTRPQLDFGAADFKPDAERAFFTVTQDGASASKCTTASADESIFAGPLIAFGRIANNEVQVQFSLWQNKKVDRDRVALLTKGVGLALGAAGVPVGLLAQVQAPATNNIKQLLDEQRPSRLKTTLSATDAARQGAIGRIGLREPTLATAGSDARVTISLVSVSSIFSQDSPTYVSLAAKSPLDILQYKIDLPSGGSAAFAYLENYIGKFADYGVMVNAASYEAESIACDGLFLKLRDELNFSEVDSLVILHAIARRKAPAGSALSDLSKIACLASRGDRLQLVGITLAPPPPPQAATRSAKASEVRDAMTGLAQLRFTDFPTDNQFDIFAFPVTVTDPGNRLGWDGGMRTFSLADRAALRQLLIQQVEKIGCWADFEAVTPVFALGLAPAGPDAAKAAKSAALVRVPGDRAEYLQFRYAPVPVDATRAQIDALAFAPVDGQARSRMIDRDNCDADWMRALLKP